MATHCGKRRPQKHFAHFPRARSGCVRLLSETRATSTGPKYFSRERPLRCDRQPWSLTVPKRSLWQARLANRISKPTSNLTGKRRANQESYSLAGIGKNYGYWLLTYSGTTIHAFNRRDVSIQSVFPICPR